MTTYDIITGATVTRSQIRALHAEAQAAGDESMVDTCLIVLADRGLGGDAADGGAALAAAREKIARALNDARAQDDNA